MAEDKEKTGERGYGNIYTPHAGAMIIHVQRESGLANRTIIFTQRQVRLFRIGAIVSAHSSPSAHQLVLSRRASRARSAAHATRRATAARRRARRHAAAITQRARRALSTSAAHDGQLRNVSLGPRHTEVENTRHRERGDCRERERRRWSLPHPPHRSTPSCSPDEWPLPVAGALLPSDSKALEIAVPVGTEIRAAGAGMVVEVADDSTLGKLIRISHRSGYETIYGGANEVHVSKGQHVAAGTVIALSGNAPGTLEPHLHFEMRRHGVAIDASSVIKKGPGHGDLQ